MIRAVLDPGVLVAAAISPRGLCRRVLAAAIDGQYIMIVCPALLAALRDVLSRPKFRRYLSLEDAEQFTAIVAAVAEHRPDPEVEPGLTPDPDDDYLVALARETDADYLVAGDPHLTGLTDPRPPVLTPRAFFECSLDSS